MELAKYELGNNLVQNWTRRWNKPGDEKYCTSTTKNVLQAWPPGRNLYPNYWQQSHHTSHCHLNTTRWMWFTSGLPAIFLLALILSFLKFSSKVSFSIALLSLWCVLSPFAAFENYFKPLDGLLNHFCSSSFYHLRTLPYLSGYI